MPNWFIWALIGGFLIVFIIIQLLCKSKKPIKKAIISILLGIIALFIVNLFSGLTGVALPISNLTVGVSAIGGIPGVTLLLLINTFI